MKNNIIILAISYFVTAISGQQKGVSALSSNNKQLSTSSTYAVVVGISDYQDPAIPDLRFADKDAEAFANYLRSNAGGKLDKDHLKVLINQQATMAQFGIALDWLWEVCKEGDQAIIYFSGHGDVEKKSLTQPGFLLCWDAPSRVYMSGGAFALPMLQEVISTLSIQNKAKVIVITDACRSGTLAGSSVGGAQATASNLAKQFGNEIKIMSCQPNEFSIEGEQWGGGRGAFSFHLIDALYGLADNNNDQFVTLQEVGRYLEDHVSNEVAPVSQVPMTVGNRNERLTSVDENLLTSIKKGKINQSVMLSAIESKGIEEDVLSKLDTSTRKIYQFFKLALINKKFMEPINACADSYYEQLIKEQSLERLHSTIKRNYAAALIDEVQQVLNNWINTNPKQTAIPVKDKLVLYKEFPNYLERAANLLGEQHYLYPILMANKYFCKAYLMGISNRKLNKEYGEKVLALLRQAIYWQPEMPHIYWQMNYVFACNFNNFDSAIYYCKKASVLSPKWIMAYTDMANNSMSKSQFDEAKSYLEIANGIDSNHILTNYIWGNFYLMQKRYSEAELKYKRVIQLGSSDTYAIQAILYLIDLYSATHRYNDVEQGYKLLIQRDSNNANTYNNLGFFYIGVNRYLEAEQAFTKATDLNSDFTLAYYNLACSKSLLKQTEKAYEILEIAFKKGYKDFDAMQQDSNLLILRENKVQWKKLMKKYFPDQTKN